MGYQGLVSHKDGPDEGTHSSHAHPHHNRFVLPLLASCVIVFVTCDLWMSQCGFDTCFLVVNFVDDEWILWHVMVSDFKVANTSRVALAMVVKRLLSEFGFFDRVLAYVKDEGANLNTMATALKFAVKCKLLEIDEPYHGTCFMQVISKACQYGTNDIVVCLGLTCVSLKNVHAT